MDVNLNKNPITPLTDNAGEKYSFEPSDVVRMANELRDDSGNINLYELYQGVADHYLPYDSLTEKFYRVVDDMPKVSGLRPELLCPIMALIAMREQISNSPNPEVFTMDLGNIFIERYAQAAAILYGSKLPRGQQLLAEIEYMNMVLTSTESPNINEANQRIGFQFGSELLTALSFRDVLAGYDVRHRERNEVERLKHENDGLFENTRFLQKYQLKPALVKAAGAGVIKDWMVLDWPAVTRQASEDAGVTYNATADSAYVLARIFGTKSEFISNKPSLEMHGSKGNQFFRVGFEKVIKGGNNTLPEASLQLGTGGQLLGMRGASFEGFASKLGKSGEYELLRGEILSIYCDLIVPAHLVNFANQAEKEVLAERQGKPRAVQTIRRLVLARIRLLVGNQEEVVNEIKKEQRKHPVEHNVVGFIRPLPKGFRATAEQRELCRRDLDKELAPEGETYVRDHKRGGKGDENQAPVSIGHRAIRRHVGGGIIRLSGTTNPPGKD